MSWCVECRKDNGWCCYCQKRYSYLHNHIQRKHPGTIRAKACPVQTYQEWKTNA